MNKIAKWGIGLAAVGGVATAIAVPVAIAVKDKEEIVETIDRNAIAYKDASGKNVTVGQLLDNIQEDQKISGSLLSDVLKASTTKLYDDEQKGSIKLQEMKFNYEVFLLNEEIADLTAPADQAKIDKKEEDKKKVEDKIAKLATLTDADYNSSSFRADYPEVLIPRKIIKSKQEKIILDQKDAYTNQFATKGDGEKAWLEEMSKKYNGATTTDEAAATLTYQIIKSDAMASQKYKINTSYTYKMKHAQLGGKAIFPFLTNAVENSVTGTATKAQQGEFVIFVSTNSKDPAKMAAAIDQNSTLIQSMASSNFTKLYHALLPFKQSKTDPTAPWEVKKEDLIGKAGDTNNLYGLLNKLGGRVGTASTITSIGGDANKKLGDIWDGDTLSDKAKAFIENRLHQPSKDKDGLLGVKPKIAQLKGMAKGFALGIIDGLKVPSTSSTSSPLPTPGKDVLNKIADGFQKVLTDESKTTNTAIMNYINGLTDAEVTSKFGSIVRDAFVTTTGTTVPDLSMKIDTNSFLVISSFGIHIVFHEDIGKEGKIATDLNTELTNAAKKQKITDMKFDYSAVFNSISTDDNFIKQQLPAAFFANTADYTKTTPFLDNLKTSYEKKQGSDKTGEDLSDLIAPTTAADSDKETYKYKNGDGQEISVTRYKWEYVKKEIAKTITNHESTSIYADVTSVTDGAKKFLNDKYDNGLLDTDSTKTVTAQDIYEKATEIAEGK